MKYRAINYKDYLVYLVESDVDQSENDIIISKELYDEMLKANQEKQAEIRVIEVESGTLSVEDFYDKKPSQYHEWSIKTKGWIISDELKLKQQREEIEQRIQFLRNEIIYLTALDEDASEEIAESKKLRAQLKAL